MKQAVVQVEKDLVKKSARRMASHGCVIRTLRSADLDAFALFYSRSEAFSHSHDTLLLSALTDRAPNAPDFLENVLLAEHDAAIIGACRVVPELAIGRVVLRVFLAPGSAASGVESDLLRSALERAEALGATKVHVDLEEDDTRQSLLDFGFRPIRCQTELTLALEPGLIPEPERQGLTCRPLEQGEEAELAQLQNHAFAGSWGFCPNTTGEIIRQLRVPGYDHDDVIVAYQGGTAVGYCWTATMQPDPENGPVIGRIHMLGVVPELRGCGFGRVLLACGLRHLAGKGVQTVELTVDDENAAGCALYRRAGFKTKSRLLWYERKLR